MKTLPVLREPYISLAWVEADPLPPPYAWDVCCRTCGTWLGRLEYVAPQTDGVAWVVPARYRRTVLPPEMSRRPRPDAQTGLPAFGLRSQARNRGRQACGRGMSGQRSAEVVGPIVAYCPHRGCESKHVIRPPEAYGPAPDVLVRWPPYVNPYTHEDLLKAGGEHSRLMIWAKGARLPLAERVRPRRV
jgi:hypothetical protein